MRVVVATPEDVDGWLHLAREVEVLFGPMVGRPEFNQALQRNLARATALCIRDANGPPGSPLLGGLLFSSQHPHYVISWLVVTSKVRSQGNGKALVEEAIRRFVSYPCTLELETFGPDHPGARSRSFFERLGFHAVEDCPPGPDGGSRQRFRLWLAEAPAWLN